MNSFFASCAQQDYPHLRKKPVAVVPMMDVNTTAILAASYEAKKFGIKTGTLVGEAKRMCPGIIFVPTESDRYVHYHDLVAEVIDTIIPVEHVLSIDEYACELKGSQREPENALEIAKQIKRKVELEVGECLTTSIGAAENILLAKMASDLQKPNGLVVILPEEREKIISPLSVRMLSGIGSQTEKRLNMFGIHTIGELLQKTEADLKNIWGGVIGTRYYHWIRGKDFMRPYEKNKTLGHQHVLNPSKRNIPDAIKTIKALLLKATVRLRRKNQYASRLSISIKCMGDPPLDYWDYSVNVPETQDSLLLMKELDQILTEHLPKKLRPLRVGITLSNLIQKDEYQDSLFEDVKRNQLLSAFDKINEKFGKEAITLASVSDVENVKEARIAFNYIPDKKDL